MGLAEHSIASMFCVLCSVASSMYDAYINLAPSAIPVSDDEDEDEEFLAAVQASLAEYG